jgi:hypothetical protein
MVIYMSMCCKSLFKIPDTVWEISVNVSLIYNGILNILYSDVVAYLETFFWFDGRVSCLIVK